MFIFLIGIGRRITYRLSRQAFGKSWLAHCATSCLMSLMQCSHVLASLRPLASTVGDTRMNCPLYIKGVSAMSAKGASPSGAARALSQWLLLHLSQWHCCAPPPSLKVAGSTSLRSPKTRQRQSSSVWRTTPRMVSRPWSISNALSIPVNHP